MMFAQNQIKTTMQTSNLIELLLSTFEQRTRQIFREELDKISGAAGQVKTSALEDEHPIKIDQLAKELGVTRQTIHNKKRTGEIPFHRLGGRVYFFRSEVFEVLKAKKSSRL